MCCRHFAVLLILDVLILRQKATLAYQDVIVNCSALELPDSFPPRPPPFPDFMGTFVRTLESKDLEVLRDMLVEDFTQPDVCNCTAAIVEDWNDYNSRCDQRDGPTCPEPTTTTEEHTTTTEELTTTEEEMTTTTEEEPTTPKPVPPTTTTTTTPKPTTRRVETIRTTVPSTSTTPTTQTTTMKRSSSSTSSSTTTTTTIPTSIEKTKSSIGSGPNAVLPPTLAGSTKTGEDNFTTRNIIIVSVCAGLLALIILIVTLCVMWKKPATRGINIKSEKFARQRSDCQPLPENEAFSSVPHTPVGKKDSVNGYSNKGFNWQEGDTNGAVISNNSLLLSDKTDEDFHYNTLKALEHPHALMRNGFGETSTDKTLPKKSKSKKKRLSKYKKTDANHNPQNSVGKNSLGNQSVDKESLKSKGSVKSKASIKSKDSGKKRDSVVLEQNQGMVGNKPNDQKNNEDDLIDGKNEHLFSYSNSNLHASKPSLPGSEVLLAPPPEFQDLKPRDSPFNSNDRRRAEDPPTTIVRPMDLTAQHERQDSHSSSGSAEKKSANDEKVSISMEDMSGSVHIIDGSHGNGTQENKNGEDGTPKPKSFLWGSPKKSSPDIIPKMPGGMQKTVM